MQIKIELRAESGGEYYAYCPEAGVSCRGRSLEDALERIKELLSLYFSGVEDAEMSPEEQAELTKELRVHLKDKNLFIPRDPKVH